MKALNCPSCGAALPAHVVSTDLASCEFCGTTFRISKTLTPEPDMGDLLLGADFSKKIIPGWETLNPEKLTFHKNSPPELRGTFDPHTNSYYLLKSSGLWDDFDAGVNIKFTGGDKEWIRGGLYTRFSSEGGYGFLVSAQASYTFGTFAKDNTGELVFHKIMAWTYHTALRPGFNEVNRLRVICNAGNFRIFLNGVMATSFKDEKFTMGKLYLVAEPSEKSKITIAFSDLQLREVPK
ncbi:hypothetical protein [Candidatus Villigracilis saccharophilus]|uniref:hypothetical protein n=1 Tax=Candidatus Villigracilis saccharophilus TaxID=3140684 RepID=UPI003134F694|nr:hypothetical protein [Anaerolineales bacterium]